MMAIQKRWIEDGAMNPTDEVIMAKHLLESTLMSSRMDLVLPVAAVPVFWDITKCPVPDDCDARRVGPCIEGFLRKLGHSGPIAITAVGKLSKVPEKILEGVSSTGITVYDAPSGRRDIILLIGLDYMEKRPPTKIVVISPPNYFAPHLTILNGKKDRNVVYPFPPDSTKAEANLLWQNLLLADPVSCSRTVTPASWVCGVCDNLAGRGFENFMRHRSSPEHAEEISLLLPLSLDKDNEAVFLNVDSPLEKNATTKVSQEAIKDLF